MNNVAIKKGDRLIIGNPDVVCKHLNKSAETVRRWVRANKNCHRNGWDIYVDESKFQKIFVAEYKIVLELKKLGFDIDLHLAGAIIFLGKL